jgi:UPF0755 protein
MIFIKKIFVFFSIILTIISAGFAISFFFWLEKPIIETNQSVQYYVEKQSSFTKISNDLHERHVISDEKLFILYAKILNQAKNIKYGTYAFTDKDTPKSILNKMVIGDTVQMKVTIPEGLNIYQIAEKLEQYYNYEKKEEWLKLFQSKDIILKLHLNEKINSLEGFLFPSTYFFDPNAEPDLVVKALVTEFKKNVTKEMMEQASRMGLSPVQFITLASIVEKETSINEERKKVAAVYWNRIKKGMMLQADPTVIYGLWDRMQGSLTKRDLKTPTDYNTYTFKGLPKGPIASPGLSSILATLNPERINALYFVASGRGDHVFSNNLIDHNKAVQRYRKFLRENK